MEMMTKAQSLDQYLWSVTKWWPRVKALLRAMKEDIEKQLHVVNYEVILQKELFPKLNHHYKDLSKKDANECMSKNVELLPGWIVINETEEIDDVTNKKTKVIEWVDRTPVDCLEEMASLCETIAEKVESRYTKRVCKAAHVLGGCFHIPNVFSLAQGLAVCGFSARQQSALYAYGKEDFHSFFKYVCSLPHVIQLAEDQPELRLLPPLLHCLNQCLRMLFSKLFGKIMVIAEKSSSPSRRSAWPRITERIQGQG